MKVHSVALAVLFAWCVTSVVASKPSFCHNYDCPKFKVLKTAGQDIELREYESTYWATTNVTGKTLSDAQSEGQRRLQQYLDKGNDDKVQIEQTTPIFTMLYPTKKAPEPSVEAKFTIEFFIAHKYKDKYPEPKRTDVNVLPIPSYKVYVQSFGGFAEEKEIVQRGFDLMKQVKDGGEDVIEDFFGFAQYDSWVRVINRHNEVWVWPKQKPS